MNSAILNVINKWKNYKELDLELKKELEKLSEEELFDAFYKDLEFGTGGMRGVLGAGTNRMNIYTIRKANYGYAKYILMNKMKEKSVVIAYDCRKNSLLFAKESAKVLASFGIKVYLFDKITPTPELSFAVRYLKATGGIVVTASHNPPKYNGYKIYDERGCQLIPDLAEIVINEISKAPDSFDIKVEEYETYLEKGLIEIVDKSVDTAYLEKVKSISLNDLDKSNFKVVFTSLHGTSAVLGQRLLKEVGYNFIPVKEQMVADANFSTVKSPNPENGEAFTLAIKYAKENDADICIATDPDADRVGLAVKHNGEFILLTGNQTGPILIDYLAKFRKLEKKNVLYNTIVTSDFGAAIAKSHGIDVVSTLTGFKYIGDEARKLEGTDREFFFGYEESYGYVVKDFVRDKDSLQALLICCEVACYYKNQGLDLVDVLESLYKKYGFYQEKLVNINLEGEAGAKQIKKTLDYFRNNIKFDVNGLKCKTKEDYELSKRFTLDKEEKLTLPKSNVLKYILENGSWFVLRPSGTEPKMKIYINVKEETKEKATNLLNLINDKVLEIINNI